MPRTLADVMNEIEKLRIESDALWESELRATLKEFFEKFPEATAVDMEVMSEYDDQGGYYDVLTTSVVGDDSDEAACWVQDRLWADLGRNRDLYDGRTFTRKEFA